MFICSVHGRITGATVIDIQSGPVSIHTASGDQVTFHVGDRDLAEKLASAINAVVDGQRAGARHPEHVLQAAE